MEHSTNWVEFKPGLKKFVYCWSDTAARQVQGSVGIVHGLGEHGGRYNGLAKAFVEAGYRVFAFDQQGHGKSPEVRGSVESYESLLDDLEAFLVWMGEQCGNLPLALFGHSMGGNLVVNYALSDRWQPSGIVASSPMIEQVQPPSLTFMMLARVVYWLRPNLIIRSEVVPERLMSDPEEQKALRDDEMFHSQITLRLGAGLIDSGQFALQNAERLQTRMLLTHGTEDTMTSPVASTKFAERAGPSCQLEIIPGAMHDPFRDLDRQRSIELFLRFLAQVTSGPVTI